MPRRMDKETFDELRESMRALMPRYMLDFEKELRDRPGPDEALDRFAYIREWLQWFDPTDFRLVDGKVLCEEVFAKYSKSTLKISFEWVRHNFAELDLGDGSWFRAAQWVAASVRGKTWGPGREQCFMMRRLLHTRWAVEEAHYRQVNLAKLFR